MRTPKQRVRVYLGLLIKEHRIKRRLSQAALAEHLDMSLKYVGEIERGESNTSIDTMEMIANAVGVDLLKALPALEHPVSGGVRELVLAEIEQMHARLHILTRLLKANDPDRRAVIDNRFKERMLLARAKARNKVSPRYMPFTRLRK
jgi:transcriptional regulator with XRE-family HTH domain